MSDKESKRIGRPTQHGEAKRSVVCIRVTPTLRAKIDERALKNRCSLTNEVERLLERALMFETMEAGIEASLARLTEYSEAERARLQEATRHAATSSAAIAVSRLTRPGGALSK